jgi:hypothetical protein
LRICEASEILHLDIGGRKVRPVACLVWRVAYSPHAPPERDYFFQYSWVIPAIFRSGVNLRRHFWFGSQRKDSPDVRLLFAFWNAARQSKVDALYVAHGTTGPDGVTAPLAVYRHSQTRPFPRERLILIQHGSYLIAEAESQPCIDRGEAVLYRGVQDAQVFLLPRLVNGDIRSRFMGVHAQTLADSVISFNAVHCNVSRLETGAFHDRSFMLSDRCREAGLNPAPIAPLLYSGYALEEWCGSRKFGPNYIKFRTPLSNIRITTFVCSETEIKVIDPNKLEVVEAVGCRVREVCI